MRCERNRNRTLSAVTYAILKTYWEKKNTKRRDDHMTDFARARLMEMKKQRLFEAMVNFKIWQ